VAAVLGGAVFSVFGNSAVLFAVVETAVLKH
jgi:hypothetical protein